MLCFQGTGRHNSDEVKELRREAIDVVADYARAAYTRSDKKSSSPFYILGGEHSTEADFTLYGYLSGLLVTPPNSFIASLIKEQPSLVSYVDRMHNMYFADFESPLQGK